MIIDDLTVSLLMLSGVRLVAGIMFALLFFRYKKLQYIILFLGWTFYMTGPLIVIVLNSPERLILDPYFGFTAAFATILISLGLFSYFKTLRKSFYLTAIFICLAGLILIYIIEPSMLGFTATIIQAAFLLILLITVIYNSKLIRQGRSWISFIWLCITLGVSIFHAFGFQLLLGGSRLSIRFVLTALINISLLIYFLYLDWEQAQAGYEDALNERSILLQEVHHRVKNNLTIVSSMLRLQAHTAPSDKKELLRNIENRINTMAIVHEQLYQSGNFKDIRVDEYIKELITAIEASFSGTETSVRINKKLQPLLINMNILIPLGMLINEIVTNAYKHAFREVASPEIFIEMAVEKKRSLRLKIADNGVGMKGCDEDVLTGDSTGFTIINALREQLCAEIIICREEGMSYEIKIPVDSVTKDIKR